MERLKRQPQLATAAAVTMLISGWLLVGFSSAIPWELLLSVPADNRRHEAWFEHERQAICSRFLMFVRVLATILSLVAMRITKRPKGRLGAPALLLLLSVVTFFAAGLLDPGAR